RRRAHGLSHRPDRRRHEAAPGSGGEYRVLPAAPRGVGRGRGRAPTRAPRRLFRDAQRRCDDVWTADDTFETVDSQGNVLSYPGWYAAPSSTSPGTGFTISNDLGKPLTLKVAEPHDGMKSGWLYAIDNWSFVTCVRATMTPSACRRPSGLSSTVSSTLTTAVFAPTPKATVRIAAAANIGCRTTSRHAK